MRRLVTGGLLLASAACSSSVSTAPAPQTANAAPRVIEQTSGVRALLIAVSATDEKTVWVSGASGSVLRTLDGGAHWEVRPVPGAERLGFRDVQAMNKDVAWVLSIGNGGMSRIYHTTDGGATWKLQFQNADSAAFYDCFTFFDAQHGVVLGDETRGHTPILRTEDGGAHWALIPEASVPLPRKGEGGFASSGGCVTSVDSKHGWIATTEARVLRTDDAGKTWTAVQTPLAHVNGSTGLTATAFRDASHGMAVAGTVVARQPITPANDTTSNVVATSSDGGKTWTLRHRPPPSAISGLTWVPNAGRTTYVAANIGGLMVTRNEGETWTSVTPAQVYWSVGASGRFAWGVGAGGRITRLEF